MRKRREWRTRIALFAGVVIMTMLAPNPATAVPGVAGECSAGGLLCGRVINDSYSERYILVADNWNCGGSGTACGNKIGLAPGERSVDMGMKDADGVHIPAGCRGNWGGLDKGPGWHKISDKVGYYTVYVWC